MHEPHARPLHRSCVHVYGSLHRSNVTDDAPLAAEAVP